MITLKYTLDQVNELLTALGELPFSRAVTLITMIHEQAIPQIHPIQENALEQSQDGEPTPEYVKNIVGGSGRRIRTLNS